MNNWLNNLGNQPAVNSLDFSKMDKKQLEDLATKAVADWQREVVGKISEAIKTLDQNNTKLDKADFSTMDEAERKAFVKKQIAEIHAAPDEAIKAAKEMELENLINQLNEKKDVNRKILTDTLGFKEYLSLSRRRFSSILKHIDNLKKDKQHYPKNVLIYAMGIVNSKYFSAGQAFKRWVAKLTWSFKMEDIKKNMENIINMCNDTSGDGELKKAIKWALKSELLLAKDKHIQNLQVKNSF